MAMLISATTPRNGSGHAADLDRALAVGRRSATSANQVAAQDLARRLLSLPADRFCAWLIALGYPGDRPLSPVRDPNRRPFDQVVHRDRC